MQYITTPHEAELNAEAVMKSWGYIDARATTGGSDGGIDVSSSRALAQVKWRGGVAGRPDLQKLYGARGADTSKSLFFFAASGYSKQAVDYANQVGIGLFVYDPTGAVTAVNRTRMPQAVGISWWNVERVRMIALFIFGILLAIGALTVATIH